MMQAASFCYRLTEDMYYPFHCQQTVLLMQFPPEVTPQKRMSILSVTSYDVLVVVNGLNVCPLLPLLPLAVGIGDSGMMLPAAVFCCRLAEDMY